MILSKQAVALDFLLSGFYITTKDGTTFCINSEQQVSVITLNGPGSDEIVSIMPMEMGIKEFNIFCNLHITDSMQKQMEAMIEAGQNRKLNS